MEGRTHHVAINALVCGPGCPASQERTPDPALVRSLKLTARLVLPGGGPPRPDAIYWHDTPGTSPNLSLLVANAIAEDMSLGERRVVHRLGLKLTCEAWRLADKLTLQMGPPPAGAKLGDLLMHPEMAALRARDTSSLERLAIQVTRYAQRDQPESNVLLCVSSKFPSVDTTMTDPLDVILSPGEVLTWRLKVTLAHRQVLSRQPLYGPLEKWQQISILEQQGVSTTVDWEGCEIMRNPALVRTEEVA